MLVHETPSARTRRRIATVFTSGKQTLANHAHINSALRLLQVDRLTGRQVYLDGPQTPIILDHVVRAFYAVSFAIDAGHN